MNHRFLGVCGLILIWGTAGFCATGYSDIVVHSVFQGVIVDARTSTSSAMENLDANLRFSDKFGHGSASFASNVSNDRFDVRGAVDEIATEHDVSFAARAQSIFQVNFELTSSYNFDLSGYAVGSSEREHWFSEVTLQGPSTDVQFGGSWGLTVFNQTGSLGPGMYTLSAVANPLVYGGLDEGSASAEFGANLGLFASPSTIPEPASCAILGLTMMCGFAVRRRRKPCPA